MAGPFRHKIAALGLAIASLFPNINKVSFMGARNITRTVVSSVGTVAAKAEPVVEKVVEAASSGGAKAAAVGGAAVGGATVIGGAAVAERACVSAGVKTVARSADHVHPPSSLVNSVERLAPDIAKASDFGEIGLSGKIRPGLRTPTSELGKESTNAADEYAKSRSFQARKTPLSTPSKPGIWIAGSAHSTDVAAGNAAKKAAFKMIGATGGSAPDRLAAKLMLDAEAQKMTEILILRVPRAELQNRDVVAAAFKAGAETSRGGYHGAFDIKTGVVRMHLERNGAVLTAEFNAYTAAEAAALVYTRSQVNLDQLAGPRGPGV